MNEVPGMGMLEILLLMLLMMSLFFGWRMLAIQIVYFILSQLFGR